jgi:predicted heme/steroid binding protein
MTRVILNKTRIISTAPVPRQTWTRPSDWLSMPSLSQGDEKIHMLVKVYEKGGNYIIFKCNGDYQVDWGDGTSTGTYSSGADAEHEFLWANAPAGSLTTGGYRQVIVTVTPQGGSTLTGFVRSSPPYHHSSTVYRGIGNSNVLSVKMAGTNFTSMYLAMWTWIALEEFEYVGTAPALTNTSNCFTNCKALKKVISFDTSNVTNLSNMFQNCESLIELAPLDTSSGTNFTSMFQTCYSIDYIPAIDVTGATSLNYTFQNCRNLTNIPISDFTGITTMTSTFSTCTSIKIFEASLPNVTGMHLCFDGMANLESIKLTIPSGTVTTMSYTFRNCVNIKEIKPFDTSNVTTFAWCFSGIRQVRDYAWVDTSSATNLEAMFHSNYLTDASFLNVTSSVTTLKELFKNCYKLEKTPASFDCTNVTTIQGLFEACFILEDFPTLNNTGNITSTYGAFYNAYGLEVAPAISGTLTVCRGMFYNAYNLKSVPAYDLSGVTTWPNGYQFCQNATNLTECLATGIQARHTYQNCNMKQAEIVAIFNNLGTANGAQTIYVDKNPGSASLTASDLLIATGKGWTVVS